MAPIRPLMFAGPMERAFRPEKVSFVIWADRPVKPMKRKAITMIAKIFRGFELLMLPPPGGPQNGQTPRRIYFLGYTFSPAS
jgi:hypothetical protein